jgi:hypothetical protein
METSSVRITALFPAAADFRGASHGVTGVAEAGHVESIVVVHEDKRILTLLLVQGKERFGIHARLEFPAQEFFDYFMRHGYGFRLRLVFADAPYLRLRLKVFAQGFNEKRHAVSSKISIALEIQSITCRETRRLDISIMPAITFTISVKIPIAFVIPESRRAAHALFALRRAGIKY